MTLWEGLFSLSSILGAWGWYRERVRARRLITINQGLLQMALELQFEVYTLARKHKETT